MATFLEKLKKGIVRTKTQVFDRVSHAIHARKTIDEDLLEEIEEIMIAGDVGVSATMEILEAVKERIRREKYEDSAALFRVLREEVARIFPQGRFDEAHLPAHPFVILVVGVNGVGKTTTIAKLARRLQEQGKSVLLAAGDTFRAAAVEQLDIWAHRLGADIIKQKSGSDPGAVVFDALQAARARGTDVVIIDTAGRLHTKVNLMAELQKIRRVIQKVIPQAPHLTLLVLDATTGQNALAQARQFISTVGVDGIVLTKLDGSAKGGAVIGIAHELQVPVEYVGLGEQMDDLQPFDPETFAASLFSDR